MHTKACCLARVSYAVARSKLQTVIYLSCPCGREEGLLSFWKGNVPQLLRIFPYSAAQLTANDQYKRLLAGGAGRRHGGSSGSSAEQVSA